jgi:hypothetical protein
MDLLYEAGDYTQVVDIFTRFQAKSQEVKFPPDLTTLAMAALYKLVIFCL